MPIGVVFLLTRSRGWQVLAALLLCCVAIPGVADNENKEDRDSGSRGKHAETAAGEKAKAASPMITDDDAITFAKTHHPELADLVVMLETSNPKAYRQAVRELRLAVHKLERLRTRDTQRYEDSLAAWRIDSRIRLLAARMSMSETESQVTTLRKLLTERQELRLKMQRAEAERLRSRLARLESQISNVEEKGEMLVEKELQRLRQSTRSERPKSSKSVAPR